MGIDIGDLIPSFEGYDNEKNLITSDDLLGSVTVLFFYLKDETPGCIREACDFRDAINEMKARGVVVIGISPDTIASHQTFSEKHQLNFSLLSDPDQKIAEKFGVTRPKGSTGPSIERTTFVIDETGTVRWVERSVRVEEHISRVLSAIDTLESV
jgi:thioredoxin-dependent peroxiredoxin